MIAVSWWLGRGPSPQEFQDLFVAPFNAGQDRIRIDLRVLTANAREQTVAALRDGTGPDIVMVPRAGDFLSVVRQGHLLDLTPHSRLYGWNKRLLTPALRMAAVDGGLYGVPRSTETMALLFDPATLDGLSCRPPVTAADLETAAARALAAGLLPFGGGCGDFPASCELLWTLAVNHHAGPDAVRAALRGELPWTSAVFADAVAALCGWFERGWFGDHYFTDTIERGVGRVLDGTAAMAPAMTGMLPENPAGLDVVPFPALRPGITSPVYVFGTASLLGINAASRVPQEAAAVLDALFTPAVRSRFSAAIPGDWNIPLAAPGSLTGIAPRIFAQPADGVTEAVVSGRHGYATWSFFPPKTEALIVDQVRPLVEGRLTVAEHLRALQDVFAGELAAGARPGL
ncbi:ABC transporter substrate-binding protein [Actinoplanes rectilineatus]|uniref:ABC transporter substrate-binding protein n=1 Tax=Actinoplanes rectilineatus TaxID=113571 RepID=UPI0005F2A824|nr:ABC transporter substrate-binding protein [Actinoplanes rectilineatus]